MCGERKIFFVYEAGLIPMAEQGGYGCFNECVK